jgi:threonine dehydrogenase-like Zn-dependent dehydrogenase
MLISDFPAFGDVNLLKLPDDVPDEKGLYLSDVLATSWHCVIDTGVTEGDVVAIWGAGKPQFCIFSSS